MRAHAALHAAALMGAGQNRILEMIASGTPLPETLRAVVDLVESVAPEMLASILLVDGARVRHGAAGRLPEGYWRVVDGEPIGPRAGSCGTAMHRRKQVIVGDIARSPLWKPYRAAALEHGLRACWSTPIVDSQRAVLGSFALYFRRPKRPTEGHLRLIATATHTAAIAIVRHRAENEREHLMRNLQERVKEISLLHDVARLLQGERAVDQRLAGELARMLPAGWQRPAACAARVLFGEIDECGHGWRATPWRLQAPFVTADGLRGSIEVAYLEQPPGAGDDPFLNDERHLLRSIADMLAARLDRDRALAAMRDRESVFRLIFENAAIGMALTDPEGRLLRCNAALARMLGYRVEELAGRRFSEITHPEDVEANLERYRALIAGAMDQFQMEKRYLRKDGSVVWAQLTVSRAPLATGEQFTIGMMEDISSRRSAEYELRVSEARYRGILEGMTVGFVALDRDLRFTYANPRATKVLGRSLESLLGMNYLEAFPEAAATPFEEAYRRVLADGVPVQSEHFFAPWQRWFEQRVEPTPEGIAIFFRDTTEKRLSQSRIEYLATHDGLTDLPNRNLVHDRITQAISHARRTGRQVAVLYLDLDRFKVINDGFGHPFGDAVLKAAGRRLSALVRESDTVARQSGDEFLILLSDLRRSSDVYIVAQKILETFAQPLVLEEREVHLSFSIGISLFPEDGQTADALVGNADVAMYRAKEGGRSNYQFFTRDMSDETLRRVEIESALRSAVARGQLRLVYQPKVDLASGRVAGCEALLRWSHPTLGAVSPARFIPAAEETGMIVPIGDWALRTACAQNMAWREAGLPPLVMAVNLSARQFLQQDVAAWVMQVLGETGHPHGQLELELTESMIANDADKAIAVVNLLKKSGVRIAIDDFGTGYSSLSHLRHFRVDTLKIDQSFVRNMETEVDGATIASAVISLAHSLRMTTVAEGVETETQLRFLRASRCDAIQGYYFSKPVPATEMEAMLRSGKRLPVG